jgi:hypothetical protein
MPLLESLQALGFAPKIIRGDPCIANVKVDNIIDGVPISYTRRRYSNTTFCWVHAYAKDVDEWIELGDPWPAVTPKRSEIAEAIKTFLTQGAA